jgi:S-adenosylmethionine synthetase
VLKQCDGKHFYTLIGNKKKMEIKNTKTCESVGMGHPDKICDQISDGVLDACLAIDKNSRVACECFACNHLIVIGGEITTDAVIDPVKIAWKILKRLEYTENDFTIISNINKQSSDISKLVDKGENALSSSVGAGDQGITVGYATNETTAFLPLEYDIATKLVQKATELKDKNIFIDAKYDMKSQVTITYDSNHQPTVDTVVFSIQHHAFKSDSDRSKFKTFIKEEIILPIIKSYKLNTDFKYYINYVGDFVIGGPFGDTGLTGRKLMVDNYGPSVQHGGGAFSGKDYTKVDRTGAYYAR